MKTLIKVGRGIAAIPIYVNCSFKNGYRPVLMLQTVHLYYKLADFPKAKQITFLYSH